MGTGDVTGRSIFNPASYLQASDIELWSVVGGVGERKQKEEETLRLFCLQVNQR